MLLAIRVENHCVSNVSAYVWLSALHACYTNCEEYVAPLGQESHLQHEYLQDCSDAVGGTENVAPASASLYLDKVRCLCQVRVGEV